jgi:hypothetical protein
MTSKPENLRPLCVNGRPHNWDLWYPRPEQLRTDGVYYARECQNLGCDAVQHSPDLEPLQSVYALKKELLDGMKVRLDSDWGPNPIVCTWCHCWLEYGDSSPGAPEEKHKKWCFAALHLNRPVDPNDTSPDPAIAREKEKAKAEKEAREQEEQEKFENTAIGLVPLHKATWRKKNETWLALITPDDRTPKQRDLVRVYRRDKSYKTHSLVEEVSPGLWTLGGLENYSDHDYEDDGGLDPW